MTNRPNKGQPNDFCICKKEDYEKITEQRNKLGQEVYRIDELLEPDSLTVKKIKMFFRKKGEQ